MFLLLALLIPFSSTSLSLHISFKLQNQNLFTTETNHYQWSSQQGISTPSQFKSQNLPIKRISADEVIAMANNTAFDPFSQSFTLLLADGTPFNVSIPDLDDFIFYGVEICINYASQLGASLILLVMLALLTKAEKRSSPIFVLNCLSLALNFVRNVLQCLYFTGPFSETYAYFGQDYSRVPRSAYATSIAATVLTFMLLVCIELSLILQAHVICITVRKVYRQTITIISIIVAALACAIRLALCIENAKYTISLTYLTPLAWLSNATNVTTTISIFWFCAVFVTKLGFALGQRRKLGLRRFGPMQIIFIMGCQTLIIPGMSFPWP